MTRAAIAATVLMLAGCASVPEVPLPPAQIEQPSRRLMADLPEVPAPKAGDDLFQSAAELRAGYARERGLRKSLQTYIRRITRSKS